MTTHVADAPIVTSSLHYSEGILERIEHGLLILSPANQRPHRRVLFTNCSGGRAGWDRLKKGLLPANRFWGCRELVRMGYEVAIAEALPDFYLHRNPLPHDLKYWKAVRDWMRPDDIIYCAHNVLYWLPLLRRLGLVRPHVVSLLYAREPLNISSGHTGIIALNPAAADHAKKLAPHAKVAHLGWGIDLNFYPRMSYAPEWFLSCGRTHRDNRTLSVAAAHTRLPVRLIDHAPDPNIRWSDNVQVSKGGRGWEDQLSYAQLMDDFYTSATASLLIIDNDPIEYTACGFTGLLEAMAASRPVILTRTSALQTEIDVEKAGCGLHVPPDDPDALAEAMRTLASDVGRARAMGERGRRLCETHYNIDRYARDLHTFFESL